MNKFNQNIIGRERNIIERQINSSLKRTWTDRFIKIPPDKYQNSRIKCFMNKNFPRLYYLLLNFFCITFRNTAVDMFPILNLIKL